jgi:hypothetical protein
MVVTMTAPVYDLFAEKDGIPKFKTPNFEITKFDCLVSVNLIFI